MLVYAGIDEAGYGPLLGPLCIGLSVFVLPEHDPADGAPNLWRLMKRAVCRSRRDTRNRIAIDDSKKLKASGSVKVHPLTYLERGVLSCLGVSDLSGRGIETDEVLFDLLGTAAPEAPWYESTTTLPVGQDPAQLRISTNRLERTLAETHVTCDSLRCDVFDAARFNEMVGRLGNKAHVNLGSVCRHLEWVWQRWPEAHPRVIVDRQGGRLHYREELQLAWPDATIQILAESEAVSRYRMERLGSMLTVSFVRDAENHHLPVALASMTAKYVRELFMLRMNRFFQGHLPDLKPTAGYRVDAERYLQDIGPLVDRLDLARPHLIRVV